MKNDLLEIITHYGIEKQLKYIHSEYFELDEAIINYESGNYLGELYAEKALEDSRKHIAEEIADVMVMLKQIQYYYNITDDEVEKVMRYKINRQIERIYNEN